MKRIGVVILGVQLNMLFQGCNFFAVMTNHFKISLDAFAHVRIWEVVYYFLICARAFKFQIEHGKIVLTDRISDMAHQFRPALNKMAASSAQIPGCPHFCWINIGLRDHTATKKAGNLSRVDSIILGLATMDTDKHMGKVVGEP